MKKKPIYYLILAWYVVNVVLVLANSYWRIFKGEWLFDDLGAAIILFVLLYVSQKLYQDLYC